MPIRLHLLLSLLLPRRRRRILHPDRLRRSTRRPRRQPLRRRRLRRHRRRRSRRGKPIDWRLRPARREIRRRASGARRLLSILLLLGLGRRLIRIWRAGLYVHRRLLLLVVLLGCLRVAGGG